MTLSREPETRLLRLEAAALSGRPGPAAQKQKAGLNPTFFQITADPLERFRL